MEIYSIGFTKKTAKQFFETLKRENIRRLMDVRLNNVSQLAGFTKRDDLRYFLKEVCEAEYSHEPLLAPTQEILDAYKKQRGPWAEYEQKFLALMTARRVEENIDRAAFAIPTVLLCSEPTPEHCHRRLVLEYLYSKWGTISIRHL